MAKQITSCISKLYYQDNAYINLVNLHENEMKQLFASLQNRYICNLTIKIKLTTNNKDLLYNNFNKIKADCINIYTNDMSFLFNGINKTKYLKIEKISNVKNIIKYLRNNNYIKHFSFFCTFDNITDFKILCTEINNCDSLISLSIKSTLNVEQQIYIFNLLSDNENIKYLEFVDIDVNLENYFKNNFTLENINLLQPDHAYKVAKINKRLRKNIYNNLNKYKIKSSLFTNKLKYIENEICDDSAKLIYYSQETMFIKKNNRLIEISHKLPTGNRKYNHYILDYDIIYDENNAYYLTYPNNTANVTVFNILNFKTGKHDEMKLGIQHNFIFYNIYLINDFVIIKLTIDEYYITIKININCKCSSSCCSCSSSSPSIYYNDIVNYEDIDKHLRVYKKTFLSDIKKHSKYIFVKSINGYEIMDTILNTITLTNIDGTFVGLVNEKYAIFEFFLRVIIYNVHKYKIIEEIEFPAPISCCFSKSLNSFYVLCNNIVYTFKYKSSLTDLCSIVINNNNLNSNAKRLLPTNIYNKYF